MIEFGTTTLNTVKVGSTEIFQVNAGTFGQFYDGNGGENWTVYPKVVYWKCSINCDWNWKTAGVAWTQQEWVLTLSKPVPSGYVLEIYYGNSWNSPIPPVYYKQAHINGGGSSITVHNDTNLPLAVSSYAYLYVKLLKASDFTEAFGEITFNPSAGHLKFDDGVKQTKTYYY